MASGGPKRIVVATAGHVDHGKTSLIRALTGVDTDRLPEEKRRGISIELGFAELSGAGISFIDVPGHERLVHTMIAGVGGVDALLLVVAADDGVMPQTREHLAVCSVLGLTRVLIALSKCDLVDAETLELAEAETRETVERFGLEAIGVARTSTATGQGIDELERRLRQLVDEVPARATSARVWLSVDRVFSLRGIGTVVTGTLTRGTLSEGDVIYVAREEGSLDSACRSLQVHGQKATQVAAPARVAINLARLPLEAVHRGDVVTKDPALPRSRRLDITLRYLPGVAETLSRRATVVVHVGTARAEAKIVRPGAPAPPQEGRATPANRDEIVRLMLERPVPCEGGMAVVLRGLSSRRDYGRVLGGGRVLDALAPAPPRRRDTRAVELRAATLRALAAGDVRQGVLHLLQSRAPRPLVEVDVERRLGLEPKTVASILRSAKALSLGEEKWTTPESIDELVEAAVQWLDRYHAQSPNELGAPLETLRGALARSAGREAADYAVDRAIKVNRVRALDAGRVSLPAFAAQALQSHDQAADRVRAVLDTAALEGLSEHEMAERSRLPLDRARAALGDLAKRDQARRLGGLWFGEGALSKLRAGVRAHLRSHPSMSVPTFKELFGVSRKQAIPLLEELDHQGVTRRQGDDRVLGPAKEK